MKRSIKKLLIIEIVFFVIFLAICVIRSKTQNTVIDAPLNSWHTDYLAFENEQWHIEGDGLELEENEEVDLLYGPFVSLPKGDYTVTIEYACEEDQAFDAYAYKRNTYYIKGARAILDKSANMTSCEFRVTEDIDNFEIRVFYNGKGDFTVSEIVIERNNNDMKRSIIYLLAIFLIINICYYFYHASAEKRKYLLCIFGMTFLTSLPLFYIGVNDGGTMFPGGQDTVFHLLRIEGIVKELRCGNFPVRISSVWLGEYGYPASIYYGDALLYIPALFRLFGFTVMGAYKIYVFLINLATVLISEYSFNKIFRNQKTAMLLTLIYATASYRLVDIYIRAAVGEYTALTFMPLIALAVYNIYVDKNRTIRKNMTDATILAIGMSGIITCHVLTAEMVAVALVLVCIICLKKTITVSVIRTYVIAAAETLLISAGFIVPFLDYYVNVPVNITDIVSGGIARTIQGDGANIGDYFAFFNNPFGDWSSMLFNPGIVLIFILAAAIVLWTQNAATKTVKILSVLSVVILFMATNQFPWDSLAHDFALFDLIAQVQYPWRYIGIAIIFLTMLLGFVLEQTECGKLLKISKEQFIYGCMLTAILMTCVFVGYYADYGRRTLFYDTANMDSYHIMQAEYLRTDTDTELFDGKIVSEGIEELELISRIGCEMDFSCKTGEEKGTVTLPVLNYKGYVVKDDAGNIYDVDDGNNNLVCISLPAGFEGNLYLRFEEPWYWTASMAISLGALLLLGIWGIRNRKVVVSE